MTEKERKLLKDLGETVMAVADNAVEEPDRAFFGSTNDLDKLRALRQRYFGSASI